MDVAISAVASPDEYDRRTLHVIDTGDSDVCHGLDVGTGEHHATAVTPAGKKAFDRQRPTSEPELREVFAKLQTKQATSSWSSTSRPRSGPCPWPSPRTSGG